jgi:hypothetical protein
MRTKHDTIELLRHSSKAMGELVAWMIANLGKHEILDITHWMESKFYVEAIDTRKGKFITDQRFGLTVDVAKGKILWNDEGGNCFVRAHRWKRRDRVKNIPQGKIHVYKDWPVKKQVLDGRVFRPAGAD